MNMFRIGDKWFGSSSAKKDLSAMVDHKLNMDQQCDAS